MRPNFFIIGAPKCGTTALTEYLRAHPQVFMTTPKEPHYFAEDIPGYRAVTDWHAYLRLFNGGTASYRAVGEASVFYLYSKVAIRKIYERFPEAKLIVMLRNPVDLAYSMHAQVLRTRDETIVNFSDAWQQCKRRRSGHGIPSKCRDFKVLLYDEIALLGAQLARVLKVFPAAQVRWWFYDDFSSDAGQVYRQVLEYLELEDDRRTEFPRVNRRMHARSQALAQFTQKPPARLIRSVMRLKAVVGMERVGVLDALRRFNFISAQGQLPSSLATRVREHFSTDICLLEKITGRDLAHWQVPPQ